MIREVGACPACRSAAFKPASGWAESFTDCAFQHPRYRILACEGCGLLFKSHTPALAALCEYYATLDFKPFDLPYLFPTDKKLLNILRRLPPGSRLLDFGCNTGRLLGHLGGDFQRFGVEPNDSAAAIAVQRGLQIVTEAEIKDLRSGDFDAIILTDVFEHLTEPTDTLRLLASRLTPGGILVIVTGLADRIRMPDWIGEHWYFRINGHLHMLSRKHLRWLSAQLGLALAETHESCHYHFAPLQFLKQYVQNFSYRTLKKHADTAFATFLSRVGVLRRAAYWDNAPATTQYKDHVLAVYRKENVPTAA
jgi:SAM-dependent methyltransferase